MSILERFRAASFKGPGFDQIRLVAAMTVLLHHYTSFERADVRLDPLFYYSGGFIHFGFLAVAVFFAISGFLVTPGLTRSDRNVIDFAAHRILRIFPALVAVVLATMFLLGPATTDLSLSGYFSDDKLYYYLKNIITLTIDGLPGIVTAGGEPRLVNAALWTLHFEVMCYIALAIVSVLGMLRYRGVWLILFVVTYGFDIAFKFDPAFSQLFAGRFVTFISLFVYFAAGATLFLFANRVPHSPILALCAFGLAMVAMPLHLGALAVPIAVAYVTIYLGLSRLPGKTLLKHDLSYGVYLIHAPVGIIITFLWPGLHTWWIAAIIAILITLIFAYLSWTFVEGPALERKQFVSNWLKERLDVVWRPWSTSANRQH